MFKTRRNLLKTAIASLAVAAFSSLPLTVMGADFAGKTVNFINFGGPGAPPDVWYRSLAPYLEKHIPGNPSINVINKPGAGSMISANYTANVLEANGLNIGSMNGVAMNKAANGDKSAKFDLNKMEIIGAQKLTRLVAVKKDGIKNVEDMMAMKDQLVIGMESNATPYFDAFFKLTGINAKIISSYQRFPNTLQAFRSGEIDAMPMSVIEWLNFGPDLKKEGAVAMWQYGFASDDGTVTGSSAVDIPTGNAVAEKANAESVGSKEWGTLTLQAATSVISNQIWAPEGTPADAAEALSKAFVAATSDPEFLAMHEKQYGLPAEWTDSATARGIVNSIIEAYKK